MQIVNPLYDKVFKYLMQNNRIARKVLSVILDQEVEKVELSQQETIVPDEKRQLTLFRLDFKADIRTDDGKIQTVLIELQKSKFDTDIRRFRNYLGANYMTINRKENDNTDNMEEEAIYPIITIYILGYKLPDVPYLAVMVNRQVLNAVTHQPVEVDSFFINHLTHRSYILQVRRLPDNRQSRLEKFMQFFNQAWCTEKKYIIDLQDIPEEFADIAQHLQKPVMDTEFRRQLEAEDEIDTIFERQETKFLKKIEEAEALAEQAKANADQAKAKEEEAKANAEQERKEKEEAKAKVEQERKEKEEAKANAEHERKEKEEAKAREEKAKANAEHERNEKEQAKAREEQAKASDKIKSKKLAKLMLVNGSSIDEIMEETGLSREEIEKL